MKHLRNFFLAVIVLILSAICLFGRPIIHTLQEDLLVSVWNPSATGKVRTIDAYWTVDDTGWQYHDTNGTLLKKQWATIQGNDYYFNKNGYMKTGWVKQNGNKYYLDSAGEKTVGWLDYKNKKYYLNSKGIMVTGWKKIKGTRYHFEKNGSLSSGWIKYKNQYYYINEDGTPRKGWFVENNKYYYLDDDGVMKTGWLQEGDVWYYFSDSGDMQTGWQAINQKIYYFDDSGSMQTGWITDNGKRYYFSGDGDMQTGWITLNEGTFYLNTDGSMHTGWLIEGTKVSYFNENGVYDKNHLVAADGSMIALTYDNGPGTGTSSILDVLEANNAHATFFVQGSRLEGTDGSLLVRMEAIGCQIGNHTYDNASLAGLKKKQIKKEFSSTNRLIKAAVGHSVRISRASETLSDKILKIVNRPIIGTTFEANDSSADVNSTVIQILEQASSGDIITLHDNAANAAKVSAILIPALKQMGFDLVTVDEMASANGITLKKRVFYSSLQA